MATDHNIRQLIINKVPTKAQYDQMVKNADELYLTPDDSNGLPDQSGQSGKFLTTNGSTASWANVPAGTVTSVRVQATSPVQSSTSTAQSSTLNTTISLADGYGDTKNPYASKTKNYVLAAPVSANGTPSFRALDKADIPLSDIIDDSTITKNSSDQIQTVGIKDLRTDNTVKTWTGTKAQYDALVPTDWTVATYNSNLSSDYSWNAVSFDGTKFLALASDGYVSTSTDGVTWSAATRISALAGSDSYWSNLCYDRTKFLAISGYHDYYMSTSTDGLTWSTATKISNLFHREGAFALCYGNGKYVLMDEYGRISTSTNGTTWSNFVDDEYPLDHCAKIIYADNKFMALASNGYVLTSTNGTTWTSTQCTNLNGYYWYNIGYDGSKYIAVSNNGYVSTSIDGLDWTAPIQNTNLSGNNLWWGSGMAYNGTRFVITTSNGYISTKDKGGEGLDSDTLYNIKNYGLYLGLTEIANVSSGDSLPDQTGNSGKFLTTNGTTVSWDNVLTTQTAYTSKGSATKVPQITTNTLGQVTGITEVTITHPTEIPSQSGNSGKFLTTNGSTVSWATVDALPSQSGQSGKFLTTNGTSASWSESTTWTYDATTENLIID